MGEGEGGRCRKDGQRDTATAAQPFLQSPLHPSKAVHTRMLFSAARQPRVSTAPGTPIPAQLYLHRIYHDPVNQLLTIEREKGGNREIATQRRLPGRRSNENKSIPRLTSTHRTAIQKCSKPSDPQGIRLRYLPTSPRSS